MVAVAEGLLVFAEEVIVRGQGGVQAEKIVVCRAGCFQYRLLRLGGTDHLWVPTTWAVLPDRAQPIFGAKTCGIVTLELGDGAPPQQDFVAPDGIAQLTILEDVPDPYRH